MKRGRGVPGRMLARTLAWIAVAGIFAVAACAGCARGRAAGDAVVFWAFGREGEVVQQMIPEFERRHSGTRVHVQQIPWSAAREKLLTAFVGDAMPDVFQAGNT